MANSGSFTTSTYGGVRNITFNWWLNSQDISGNYSDIGWNFVGSGSNSSTWYYTLNGYLNVNGGRVFTQSSTKVQLKVGTVLASGTTRIYHNNDGTKSFGADGGATIYSYGTYQTGSGSWSLPTIPRASSGSGGTGNIGSAVTINISRASSNFVHTLTYAFGNLSGTIASNVGASCTWTLPTSFYSQIPNANSGVGTITCYTYSNGVHIGTKSWNFTAKVVNSNPTFNNNQLTYLDSDTNIVNITKNNQHIVRNVSNLKVTFTGATARNSASIARYEITFNGNTQTKTSASTINYGKVNSSKNLSVSVKAVDSRGNSTTISKTITILDWVNPIGNITAGRINNYEDETKLKVSASISSVNSKNSIVSIKYRYKKANTSTYSSYTTLNNNQEVTIVINKLYVWDFQVVIQDKFGSTTYNFQIAKGLPILFIDTIMQSVGINCFPSKDDSLFVSDIDFFDIFPVGSTKLTTNNVNPSTYFKGTWELITSGKLISGVDKNFYLWHRIS